MSEIKMKYLKGYCEYKRPEYCRDCHTSWGNADCYYYHDGSDRTRNVIAYGDCVHAEEKVVYKAMSVKNYEAEYCDNPDMPEFENIILTVGKKKYICTELIIDGIDLFKEYEKND